MGIYESYSSVMLGGGREEGVSGGNSGRDINDKLTE